MDWILYQNSTYKSVLENVYSAYQLCFQLVDHWTICVIIFAWSGGIKFGSVHISGSFTDDPFTFVTCVCSQRKYTYVLSDTRVKRLYFLEWREVPEL